MNGNIEDFDKWFYLNHYEAYLIYWNEFNHWNLNKNNIRQE